MWLFLLVTALAVVWPGTQPSTNIHPNPATLLQEIKVLAQQHETIMKLLNKTTEILNANLPEPRKEPPNNATCSSTPAAPICNKGKPFRGTYTGMTQLQCAAKAAQLGAVFYRYKTGACEFEGRCRGYHPNPCCCQWKPLKSTNEYLLLRVLAHSGVMPYSYMLSSPSSMCSGVKPGSGNSFRSPLFLIEKELEFSKARLQFIKDGKSVAEVKFRVRERNKSLLDGEWYQRKNIYAIHPWSMSEMISYKFLDPNFKMKGFTHGNNFRRFYISGKHRGCTKDTGFLAVLEKEGCPWGMTKRGYPLFVYNSKPRRPWNLHERADEMRIYGTVETVDENLFIRSETCASC